MARARSTIVVAGIAVGFFLLLVYATLTSTSTPRGDARDDLIAATRECQRAVRETVGEVRFPFEPNVQELSGDQLQLSGSMDSGRGVEAERRNYVCILRAGASSGEYVADSVEVWKSH